MHRVPEGWLWLLITGLVGLSFIGIPAITAWVGTLEMQRHRVRRGAALIALALPLLLLSLLAWRTIYLR